MRRRLVFSYLAVAALILLALEVPLAIVYSRHEHDIASATLQREVSALASLSAEPVEHHDSAALTRLAAQYRQTGGVDVEIVASDGTVLVPPQADEAEFAAGPVRARLLALLTRTAGPGHIGDGDEMFAYAAIGGPAPPVGAVVVTTPAAPVTRRVHAAWLVLGLLAGGVLVGVAGLGLVVARSVVEPLVHLENAALRLGGGDLGARAPVDDGPPEVRALSWTFNQMAARLEELVTAQQGFVADASHQLRSPLTALRLRLENVAAGSVEAGDLDAVLAELDRLTRVVDGLLVLARSEGRRPVGQAADIGAVVGERRDAWSALAEEAGLRIEYDPPAHPLVASWVPGHLEQILDNLLANAVDATPEGNEVRLEVEQVGEGVEVHVVDSGRGMTEEERGRAFDRFWRGPKSEVGGGSGLGLAIVRQLARANGSDVELRRDPGGGIDAVVRSALARPSHSRVPKESTSDR